ncbi:MAG TPA: penicillin-binding transpeptidase domain-containing protein [Candidatus Cloacimonas sp.]|jgi:cell division protein FtsI/penicillin-binding protein 2|nr:penicillin-binding transpeptidase domain-containing protein [Candidatus Cloacimonas sp.]HOQ77310.1 penicillin-binding transpeptidase domain-containing protein [Candidatus Cloacimonas sp.]HPN26621.1 penicillin-binding transpeptidase domain-containing protein [Candidatus Cloacimonas sp.]HPV64300.1 penicillin-binding transpeptidase domain-containing protein [Candidatus Cloacimonas sp.]HQB49454.1 penicillin-binding transpeptidase domain-containing protein [Candidatus Cloacimonas sp.]
MKSRFYFLVVIFGLASIFWVAYLFCIQILDPFHLAGVRRMRYTPKKEILIPRRGSILDSQGNLLVSSISYYQIDIDRSSVAMWAKDNNLTLEDAFAKYAELIAAHTSLNKDEVLKRLTIGNKNTSVQISNKISEVELDKLIRDFKSKEMIGLIHSFASMRRIYSKDILAARVMGSVREVSDGYDPATHSKSLYQLSGVCGIESTYDKYLSGNYGWKEIVLDANHRPVPYPNLHSKKPQNGYNVYLTIDSKIQEIVENALFEGMEQYSAKNAGAIVMDPNTGKIIAMAGVSRDDRIEDPNLVRVKTNIPVSFMFEPGSTMKPLTMLPAIEYKLVKPTETFQCGRYQTGRRVISDTHQYGNLTPREIIVKSSNVGIAKIAERIGPTRLYEKFIALGFGQKTALNMTGESSGMFAKLQNWDGYTLHSVSFGQGISTTALQLATAYCAIANGGKLMKPIIVDTIRDEEGKIVEQFEPTVLRNVSTPAATDTIKSYLQGVVDNGTAKHIKMDYIQVGGKTGTAQKNITGTKGYSEGKYSSVFVGMFPIEDPQMVIVVFYDEPAPGFHFGSTSSAPTFKKIVENILFMPDCQILPYNERLMQTSLTMPKLIGMHLFQAERTLNYYGFQYKVEGPDSASVVIDQYPKEGVTVDPHYPITLKIGPSADKKAPVREAGIMPNLIGLSLREALKQASAHGLAINIRGSGIVRSQSILPGSRILEGSKCHLEASL